MELLLSEGCNYIKNEINSSNLNTVLFKFVWVCGPSSVHGPKYF